MPETQPEKPAIRFLREDYRLKKNPFPAEAIVALGVEEKAKNGALFDPEIYPGEVRQYFERFIASTLADPNGPRFGALWSVGEGADPRGFGKSNLGKWASDFICSDFGKSALDAWGPDWYDERPPILAAYASFDKEQVGSFHAVVFEHVLYLSECSEQPSVLARLRNRALEQGKVPSDLDPDDADEQLIDKLLRRRAKEKGRTLDRLNTDILRTLLKEDDDARRQALTGISGRSRNLSGLHYLDALFAIADLAGIHRLYLFVDQVEDLADQAAVPKAKRKREVERFRDMAIELSPFNRMSYFILTMHPRGKDAISDLWREARLPNIDYTSNESKDRCVVLKGIETAKDAGRLLGIYLAHERIEKANVSELHPFDKKAIARLRDRAEGRPGWILMYAARVLNEGAKRNSPVIGPDLVDEALDDEHVSPKSTRLARPDPTA